MFHDNIRKKSVVTLGFKPPGTLKKRDGFFSPLDVLSAVAFAVRATIHTTTQATPMQLVFGRDAMLNIQFTANWKMIKERKQKLIKQNNKRENSKRSPHQYQVGDEILIKQDQNTKFGTDPCKGPFTVTDVRSNGTVRVHMGIAENTYNIRMITPYHCS